MLWKIIFTLVFVKPHSFGTSPRNGEQNICYPKRKNYYALAYDSTIRARLTCTRSIIIALLLYQYDFHQCVDSLTCVGTELYNVNFHKFFLTASVHDIALVTGCKNGLGLGIQYVGLIKQMFLFNI